MHGRWRPGAPLSRVQEGAWSRNERHGELCWAGHGGARSQAQSDSRRRLAEGVASKVEEWGARCRPLEGRGAAGMRAGKVRRGAGHGRHVLDMWPPQGYFNEHVVAYEMG
jgi:hypothetical protein